MHSPLHPDDRRWTDYRFGRLSDEETADLDSHLQVCPECNKRLAALSEAETRRNFQSPRGNREDQLFRHFIDSIIKRVARDRRYCEVEFHRRGGMGIILKAKLKSDAMMNSIPVVLKVFDPAYFAYVQNTDPEKGLQRFLREGRVGLSLQPHPRIIPILATPEIPGENSEKDTLYLIEMRPVHAVALDEYFTGERKPPIDEELALDWAQMLGEALAHLDNNGVVHRDLKPDNCLVNSQAARFSMRLLDFGIAKDRTDSTLSNMTEIGTTLGSRRFRAPEQEGGAAEVDIRADLYALGITLGWALSDPADWKSIDRGIPQRTLDRVSRPIRDLLIKLTQARKENRYQSPAKLLADLTEIRERMRGVQPSTPLWKRTAIRKIAAAVCFLAILVVPGNDLFLWVRSFLSRKPVLGPADSDPSKFVDNTPILREFPLKPIGDVLADGLRNFAIEGECKLEKNGYLRLSIREQTNATCLVFVLNGSLERETSFQAMQKGEVMRRWHQSGTDLFRSERWARFKIEVEEGVARLWLDGAQVMEQTKVVPEGAGAVRVSGDFGKHRNIMIRPLSIPNPR